MFVTFRGSVWGLLRWQWKSALFFTVAATVVVLLERFLDAHHVNQLLLPLGPVAVVGGAIGIFVSFRTNSAYDRWWEGRKLWGRLINTSRHLCTQLLTYLPGPEQAAKQDVELGPPLPSELQRTMIRRHIAYVHALRALLRQQHLAEDEDFAAFLAPHEAERTAAESNPTHALLHTQLQTLFEQHRAGHFDGLVMQSFDESIRHLLDIQGGCERIKKTPFPRGYGFIAERLTYAFSVLLPLGLIGTMNNDWVIVPLTVLVCLSFALISEVGRVLEDPFTMFWPALPLSALSKTIEINLRQRLSEADLPPLPKPDGRGVLM